MRIKHFFGLAVLAAMTASCSSNNDLVNGGNGNGEITNEATVGYAAFNINLPSVNGTRAADAGGAETTGGEATEYKVKSATALIFQQYGLKEGDYKFVESIDIQDAASDWNDDTTDGITTSKKLVAQLTDVKNNKNSYYVLILLNNKKTDGGVKIALPTLGQSYSDWNNNPVKPDVTELASDNDFYMANAPLKATSTAAPTTLVPITTEYIYPTKAKAEAGANAAEVYVERGVAKMTVTANTTEVKDRQDKTTVTKSTVKFDNWALDITNKKAYAVHNVDGLTNEWAGIWDEARFTGKNNRVYWAKDPNYSDNDLKTADETNDAKRKGEFNFIDATTNIDGTFTKPAYCLENTFNLANMYQGQTTRVIFKATYTPKDDAGNSLAEADGTFYTIGNLTSALNTTKLVEAVNKAAESVLAGCTVDITTNIKKEGSHVITCADIKKDGAALDATAHYGTKTGAEIVKAINDALGLKAGRPEEMVGINTYAKGVTYYIARVKHFGDTKTPWSSGNEKYGTGDAANQKYLGRYGMLRNNWYELKVGNVYGPGYPGVPPVDPTLPDDENEKYLSVSVKILSWAKRSYTVDL